MLTHFAMMAAAPLYDIPRAATWVLEASAGIGFVTGLAVLTTAAVAMAASDFNTPPLGDISPELFFTGYFTGTTALGLIGGAIVLGTGFNNAPMAQRRDSNQKQSNSWLRPQLSPLVLHHLNLNSASVQGVLASWRY